MGELEDLIYKTKRPVWHLIIAFLLYVTGIVLLYITVQLFSSNHKVSGLKLLQASIISLICAGGVSFIKRIYVDSSKKVVRFNFTLFGFKIIKDTIFTDVKYISVYYNKKDKDFAIYIWLTETKKENISIQFDKEEALLFAKRIAKGLDTAVYDATEKGNFNWIDKSEL